MNDGGQTEEAVVPNFTTDAAANAAELKKLDPNFSHKTEEEIAAWIQSRTGTLNAEWIKARIAKVEYFALPNGRSTICVVELDNRAIVTGESHVLNRENYNEDIGKTISYNRAFDKLWELFGFSRRELNFFVNEGNSTVTVK